MANKRTEKQKFRRWLRQEIKNGLVDIKFFYGDLTGATEESVYGELNRIRKAKDLPDPEVLGKYSPV